MTKREQGLPARRVTMKDVARKAGVSQPTVSFVMNDRRDVSVAEETRARVLQAAKDLRFQPNRAAQSLRSNRPFTVGVIADRIVAQPYAGQIVLGIQQAVQPSGYVCFVVETSDTPDRGKSAVENLVAQGIAGLIYAAPGPEAVRAAPAPAEVPSVFVNCWPSIPTSGPIILADERQGGYDAASAVFAAGHVDVAFIGGTRGDYACVERERGLEEAASEAGIDSRKIRREYGTYHVASGYTITRAVLEDHQPTALICGNDRMAVGALMALHEAGLECPGDVSIVGFDDQPDLADQLHPPLATVALPHLQMGLEAGRLLISGEDNTGRRFIPCRFIDRGSLAPPRQAQLRA